MQNLFKGLAVVAAVILMGCSESPPPAESKAQAQTSPLQALVEKKKQVASNIVEAMTPEMLTEQARQGGELFVSLCADCHPRSGRGDYLKRIPATLLVRRSEAELVEWMRGIDKHRTMPSFVDLEQSQLEALAAYLAAEVTR